MKVIELVKIMKKEKPELFDEIPEQKVADLVSEVFAQIGKKLDEQVAQDTVMWIQGLGRFRTRIVEKEREGRKVTEQRILFRLAKTPLEKTEE